MVLAQLLNQFHDQLIISTNSSSLLNDTNQLLFNRSARYVQQDINQFRSIENLDLLPQDDFQFQDFIYHESGNNLFFYQKLLLAY